MAFKSAFSSKLVYVYAIPDKAHRGSLKVGETTIDTNDWLSLRPNCSLLNKAAKERINEQTRTAGIAYQLLYTECLSYLHEGKAKVISDNTIHDVLLRSGIKHKYFNTEAKANEWFITDLETIKNAIKAAKEGRQALRGAEISTGRTPVIFREEQNDAINKTQKRFDSGGKKMLWYAKMRFGKTLTALQVIKLYNFSKTIIITHRPVVDNEWFTEYDKIFYDRRDFAYGSKNYGESFANLEKLAKKRGTHYVYFASIQDLRGSDKVGGKFDKNNEIFKTKWDLVIIDEAHEGTQTDLGQNVQDALVKDNTKVLLLSGTPFNLLDDFNEAETYTWDYVMEQRAKANWDLIHCGDSNPYASLPRMNIYTYDLGKLYSAFKDDGGAFNFKEFFRTEEEDGAFKHKNDVFSFLNLLCKKGIDSEYPYSKDEYRQNFRHSLWMVPGVKEAKALSLMLQKHPVFGQFKIVNVAGDGDEETNYSDAKKAVLDAIGDNPDETYTITLSCGRLTTGVSVKPWTAVFMLSGSYSTAAAGYMQTIFRVQTPATINGRVKQECFVFDFAPDRTLKVVAETAKFSIKGGRSNNEDDRTRLGEFLNFCPIIAMEGSKMKPYSVPNLLEQLKRVYIERVVSRGFEDVYLYDNDALMQLDELALEEFKKLKGKIGSTKANHKTGEVDVNTQGFTEEERELLERVEKKKRERKPLTEEEKRLLEEKREKNKNRLTAISILRSISIRMPLLLYGADIQKESDINLDNFSNLIDDLSWEEFMPKGITKSDFETFKKYYDKEVFAASGRRIREMARAADGKPIEERIERIASIFGAFRNPDKETVLTPWRVVNIHMSDCLGGWNFYDESNMHHSSTPRFVDKGEITRNIFAPNSKILEINSKSGLYPLYMTYGIYRAKLQEKARKDRALTDNEMLEIWDDVVSENIFVVCKTPMAKSITKRTLLGFRNKKANTRFFEDLLNQITNKRESFINKVLNAKSYSSKNIDNIMKFNAVVGNPPYQLMGGSGGNNDAPIFQHFCDIARSLTDKYCSLIIPSRWFAAGRENLLKDFRHTMLSCGQIQEMTAYINSKELFNNVEIKGGVCYYLLNKNYQGDCLYTLVDNEKKYVQKRDLSELDVLIRNPQLSPIVKKVKEKAERDRSMMVDALISSDTPFGIPSNPRQSKKNPFHVYETKKKTDDILLYHIDNSKRCIEYVRRKDIVKNKQDIDKYKVFIPGGYGAGEGFPHQILGVPEYAPKGSVCSQSYLYAVFNSAAEAKNFITYLKTKFFRVLVLAMKITQSAPNRVYRFVPVQDFSKPWTDEELYKKYKLTPAEISFVESMIKPME